TTLKIAVFAPIPRASVITATMAKPGLLSRVRTPYRASCQNLSISHLDATYATDGKSHASRISSEVMWQDQLTGGLSGRAASFSVRSWDTSITCWHSPKAINPSKAAIRFRFIARKTWTSHVFGAHGGPVGDNSR